MAKSVSKLLVMLLLVCSMRVHGNTFNVTQSPRSTNVTLLEGDNAFLSFVILNPVDNMGILQKINKFYKNGSSDKPQRFYTSPSLGEDILRLNQTKLHGNLSANWPTVGADGGQHIEHIMRVAHGDQLANITRLNIQFVIVDSDDRLLPTTISFNIVLESSTIVQSSEIDGTSEMVQPTVTSDSTSAMLLSPSVSPTPFQTPASSPDMEPNLSTVDSEPTPNTDSLDFDLTPESTSSEPHLPNTAHLSSSINHIETPFSASAAMTGTLSVSGFIIIALVAIIAILAILLYIEHQKNKDKNIPFNQSLSGQNDSETEGPETDNSHSTTTGATSTVISSRIHGDCWDDMAQRDDEDESD